MAAALAAVREQGAVDVLLHCAGVEISHYLPEKPQREYDLVFDVKADGWFNLLRALRGAELGTAVVFSSIAGPVRQRRPDRLQRRQRPDVQERRHACAPTGATRAIAVDWTAWAEIGMASRGSIPKMMEMAGIDMLPPAGRHRRACAASSRPPAAAARCVVAGALGVLRGRAPPDRRPRPDAATQRLGDPHGPMSGRIEAMTRRRRAADR